DRADDFLADNICPDIGGMWNGGLIKKSGFGLRHVLSRFDEPHFRAAVAVRAFCDVRVWRSRSIRRNRREAKDLEKLIALPFIVGDAVHFRTIDEPCALVFQKARSARLSRPEEDRLAFQAR